MESVFIWLIAISIVSALMFYANIYVYVFIERPQLKCDKNGLWGRLPVLCIHYTVPDKI